MSELSGSPEIVGFEARFAEEAVGTSTENRRRVLRLLDKSLGRAKAFADYCQKMVEWHLARCEKLAQDPETDPAELERARKFLGTAIHAYRRAAEEESKLDRQVTLAREGVDKETLREGEAVRRAAYARERLRLQRLENEGVVDALVRVFKGVGLKHERRQHAHAASSNGSSVPAARRQTRSRDPRPRRARRATAASRDGPLEDDPHDLVDLGGLGVWLLGDGVAVPLGQLVSWWRDDRPDSNVLRWLLDEEKS